MLWSLLFGTAFLTQVVYWLALRRGFAHALRAAPLASANALPPMSIIVAARDEADNLPGLLAALARQTHPDYEVVIVDDASEDGTAGIVEAWARSHPAFRLVRAVRPQAPRKKHALTQGIAAARHGLLAFTDADCAPEPRWLEELAHRHAAADGPALLVGYSPYRRRPGLLNALASYETFVTGFLTAAAIGLGRPYMAVGRNMSYPRAVFDAIDGFAHSQQSLSGDDDLLVQEVVRRGAARVHHVFAPATFVPTDAPPTWRRWIHQKRRHTSAGRFYTASIQRHLLAFHATGIALWLAPVFLGWVGVALLAGRLALQYAVLHPAATVLHERRLLPAQPLLEALYTLYTAVIAPLGALKMPGKW